MIIMGEKKPGITTVIKDPHEDAPDKDEHESVGKMISQELIDAVHAKDESAVWSALKTAFLHLDSEPHEEGPHIA